MTAPAIARDLPTITIGQDTYAVEVIAEANHVIERVYGLLGARGRMYRTIRCVRPGMQDEMFLRSCTDSTYVPNVRLTDARGRLEVLA
jgi:hypothetical protein